MGYFFEVILLPENMNRSEKKFLRLSKIGCNNPLELSVRFLGISQAKKMDIENLGTRRFWLAGQAMSQG